MRKLFAVVSIITLVVSVPVLAQKYNFDVENVGQNCNAAYKGLLGTADPALPD
jgi:hypothetical protein